jgi:hypothetical protein
MKNPWVLAIINFITIGLGTVLLGKRIGYGLLLLVGGTLLRVEEIRIAPLFSGVFNIHWVPAIVGLTLLGIATGAQVYEEAKAG